jgi:hypothetical protein
VAWSGCRRLLKRLSTRLSRARSTQASKPKEAKRAECPQQTGPLRPSRWGRDANVILPGVVSDKTPKKKRAETPRNRPVPPVEARLFKWPFRVAGVLYSLPWSRKEDARYAALRMDES